MRTPVLYLAALATIPYSLAPFTILEVLVTRKLNIVSR
jgi:hypothetical protein